MKRVSITVRKAVSLAVRILYYLPGPLIIGCAAYRDHNGWYLPAILMMAFATIKGIQGSFFFLAFMVLAFAGFDILYPSPLPRLIYIYCISGIGGFLLGRAGEAIDQWAKKGTVENDRDLEAFLENSASLITQAVEGYAREHPGEVMDEETFREIVKKAAIESGTLRPWRSNCSGGSLSNPI